MTNLLYTSPPSHVYSVILLLCLACVCTCMFVAECALYEGIAFCYRMAVEHNYVQTDLALQWSIHLLYIK